MARLFALLAERHRMKHPRGLKKQRAQGTVDREDAEQSTMPDRWEMKLWHNNRGLIRPPESCRMRVNGLACRPKHRLPPSRAPWGMFPTNVELGMEHSLIILPGERVMSCRAQSRESSITPDALSSCRAMAPILI